MEIDMNHTTEPLNRNIPIEDMTFFPPDKEQEALILQELKQQRKKIILPPAYPVTLHCNDCKCRRNYCKI